MNSFLDCCLLILSLIIIKQCQSVQLIRSGELETQKLNITKEVLIDTSDKNNTIQKFETHFIRITTNNDKINDQLKSHSKEIGLFDLCAPGRSHCITCDSQEKERCYECYKGYFPDKNGKCMCNLSAACTQCNSDNTTCLACAISFVLEPNIGCICKDGYNHCKVCYDDKLNCLECDNGYEARIYNCDPSLSNGCKKAENGLCIECINGLKITKENICDCQEKLNNCEVCSEDYTHCNKCSTGYIKYMNGCICSENNGCKKCWKDECIDFDIN